MASETKKAAKLSAQGAAFHQAGHLDLAEDFYRRSLACDPRNIDALHLMGLIKRENNDLDEAERLIKVSLLHNSAQHGALSNLAEILIQQGKFDEALDSLRKALKLIPDFQPALINLAVALSRRHKYTEAEAAFANALLLFPANVNLRTYFAEFLLASGREDEARAQIASLRGTYLQGPAGLRLRAKVLSGLMMHAEAAECLLEICRNNANALDTQLAACHEFDMACDWSQRTSMRAELLDRLNDALHSTDKKISAVGPFALLAITDAPDIHLDVARRYARSLPTRPKVTRPSLRQSGKQRLRLGYLSADFHAHATAFLIAGVFEHHDRNSYEVFAYSTGPQDGSPTRDRIAAGCEHFIDLAGIADALIAERIAADGIDILIDLKGHTQDSRSAVILSRPAPVQVNYLGYPGSLGMDFVDYVIADPIVVPDLHREHFSEKVVRLPVCYQPNDDRRQTDTLPTRQVAGLPEDGIVLCCFNRTYKYSPELFDVWCRVLLAVPNSVLWLLVPNDAVSENIRREANIRGIPAERVIFAEPLPPAQHWARIALADVFVDTFPYGAHTTASDALWMGVPVITLAGTSFASRVAASLLSAVGLPELATNSLEDYERILLRLASDFTWRTRLQQFLREQGRQSPLFDTARYTRELEWAFSEMWERHSAGLPTEHFDVPEQVQY